MVAKRKRSQLHQTALRFATGLTAMVLALSFSVPLTVAAEQPQNPQNGSVGLEATVSGPPPQTAPSVTVPGNGQVFSSLPITVAGLCLNGLLVKVFDNNVFVGSTVCKSGSYTLQISLFSGANLITARQYDSLDQSSPLSNGVTVTYNAPISTAFNGPILSLTSSYAERGANPGQLLNWPVILSGGNQPYAMSVDWGDGTKPQLLSESFSGTINLSHTYTTAGTYAITVQVTDKNGETAFLQVVAVINGAAIGQKTGGGSGSTTTRYVTKIIWWPVLILLPLLILAYWLGGRQSLTSLQRKLERSDQDL